jgi:hypothetical protein
MRYRRTISAVALTACSIALSACSDQSPLNVSANGATLELIAEAATNPGIELDPSAATLFVNEGIIIRARVLDASGAVIAGAQPTWRSSDEGIAAVRLLPDSVATPGARASVVGVATGEAQVTASYAELAATTRITVRAKADSGNNSPPPQPLPSTFDASITVLGYIAGPDSSTSSSELLPGSSVTLTLVPPALGDSTAVGTPRTGETRFATAITDAQSRVRFTDVPRSRFRIDIVPPAGSSWKGTSFTSSAPFTGSYTRTVLLMK